MQSCTETGRWIVALVLSPLSVAVGPRCFAWPFHRSCWICHGLSLGPSAWKTCLPIGLWLYYPSQGQSFLFSYLAFTRISLLWQEWVCPKSFEFLLVKFSPCTPCFRLCVFSYPAPQERRVFQPFRVWFFTSSFTFLVWGWWIFLVKRL